MATDVEKLVVQLSADFRSYENAMAKASGITRKELANIKASAVQAGDAGAAAFTGASAGLGRFGQQAQKTGANIVNLRGQTANLGAQFQDIAVQLQSGTSPLTIALQQGTQISAVLGGAGAGGAVKALGAAFASIVSPVSLVTIGIIAAGSAAIQYFSSLLSDGPTSTEEIKKHADQILRVVEGWENAPDPVARYAAALATASTAAERQAVIEERIAEVRADVAEETRVMGAELAKALETLNSGDLELTGRIGQLQQAFFDLEGKVADGADTQEDFEAVSDALAHVIEARANPALIAFAGHIDDVGRRAGAATTQINLLNAAVSNSNAISLTGLDKAAKIYQTRAIASADVVKNQERLNNLTAEGLELENETNRLVESGVLDRSVAARLAGETIAAEERRAAAAKTAKGGASAADKEAKAAEREREAVRKLVEQLEFENTLIGKTNVEREKAVKLRQATSAGAATPEDIARIEAAVESGYALNDALKANEETLERLRGLSREVLGGMFEDLRDGADMAEVLANALSRVGENLVTAGLDALVEGAFKKPGAAAGTGFLSRLFHQGGVVGEAGPSRMVSPALFAGAPRYHNGGVAGLRPGEVPAILQKGETVIPKGGGGSMAISIDVSGARGNAEIMSMVEAGVSRGLRAYDSTMPERVMRISADPRKRR